MSGFEIYNQNGVLIFDGVRAPFTLQDKITVTGAQGVLTNSGTGTSQVAYYLVTVTLSSATSVIALQGGPTSWGLWKRSGTQATFITTNGTSSNVLTIFSFGISPPVRSRSGLELYDTAGNVIFTSNDKALRPITTESLALNNSDTLWTSTGNGSSGLAFIPNNKYVYIHNYKTGSGTTGNTFADYSMFSFLVSGGTATVAGLLTRRVRRGNANVQLDDPWQTLKRGTFTLIDVTNF